MNTPAWKNLQDLRPKIIPSLRAGFDAVASHIWLILLPIIVDLTIWLGPHLGIRKLLEPLLLEMSKMPVMDNTTMTESLSAAQAIWSSISEHFNLTMALRSYPIGTPSLMANWLPLTTPFGNPIHLEVESSLDAIGWWIILSLIGLMIGALFFSLIAKVTGKEALPITPGSLGWTTWQSLLLVFSLIIALIVLSIPVLVVLGSLTLVNPILGQGALFLGGILVVWLIVPLIFTPHGIFALRLPFVRALATSVQVVRFTYSGTGFFLLLLVVISQGLDMLWQVPKETSWLTLVGILGHAFVNTGVIAASFFYYRDSLRFVQEFLTQAQQAQQAMSDVTK